MMTIELEYAKEPVMQATGIELICKFTHLDVEVPFFAKPDDYEQHGRDIFHRAIVGEFGAVIPFIPPTPQESSDKKKGTRMQNAIRKVQHYEMINDTTKINAWRHYYCEVFNGVIDPIEPE